MSSESMENFASRYIVDVSVAEQYIELGDASRAKFYIDKADEKLITQFKIWLKSVFLKGVSGTLTLFQYKRVECDGELHAVIQRFFNLPNFDKQEENKNTNKENK